MTLEKLLDRDDIPEDAKILISRVITEQKQSQYRRTNLLELSKHDEGLFHLIFDKAPIGIELYNVEGQLIDANQTCLDIFGVSDLQKIEGFNLFHDPNIPDNEKAAMKQGNDVYFETQFDFNKVKQHNLYDTSKSGIIFVDVFIQPLIPDIQSSPIGYLVHVQDITERKMIEEALKESKELFTQFMDHLPAATFIKDKDSKTLFANKYLKDVFGGEKWIGKTTNELFPEEIARKMITADQKALNEGLQIITEELMNINYDVNSYQTFKFPIKRENKENLLGGIAIDISEQKKAEEELKKFKTIVDNAGYGVGMIDMQGNLSYANEAFAQIHGYTTDEIINRNLSVLHTEEQMKNVGRLKEQLEQQGSYIAEEVWHKRKDNTVFPTSMNGTLITDEKGTPQFMVATAIDITEQKQAEEALRESEERYRELFNNMSSGVAVYEAINEGEDFIFKDFNKTGEAIDNISKEELIGKSVSEKFPGIKEIGLFEVFQRVWKTKIPEHHPISFYEDQKITGWRENFIYKLPSGEIVAIYDDVTTRKQVEEALEKSEKKYRHLFESAPIGIAISNLEGNVIVTNQKALEITGYTSEEIKTISSGDMYVNPEERKKLFKEIRESGQVRDFEVQLKRKDGTPYYCLLNINLMELDDQKVLLTTQRDLTEQREMDRAKRESEEEYRSFVQNFQGIAFKGYQDFSIGIFSGNVEEITGFSEDDFIKEKIVYSQLIHPEDLQQVNNEVKDFNSSSRRATQREYRIIDKNGKIHFVLESIQKFYDEEERMAGVYGTIQDITERKEAEEALKESEEKYRNLFHNANDSIFLLEAKNGRPGRVLEVNDVACTRLEYSRNELITMSPQDFADPATLQEMLPILTLSFQTQQQATFEMVHITKSGRKIPVEISSHLFNLKGKEVILSNVRDMTERKNAEKLLRESESKYSSILRAAPSGIGVLQNRAFLYISDFFLNMIGYSRDELIGQTTQMLYLSEEEYEKAGEDLYQEMEQNGIGTFDTPLKRKDGQIIDVHIRITPTDPTDLSLGVTFTALDITERKKTERLLQESELYLKEAQTLAQIGSWRLIPETSEVTGSDELFRIFGLNRTEGTLDKFLEVVHPDDREFDLYHIRRGMEEGIPWNIEHRVVWNDGTIKYVHVKGEPITDNKGKVVQLVGTVQDITERKKTAKLESELVERRDNFVWMTSHELRTPLTVIFGYIDFLQKNPEKISRNKQDKILKTIKKHLKRLEKLTDQVSLIAQFKHGTFQIKESEFNFCTFFKDTLEPYKNILGKQIKGDENQIFPSTMIKGDKDRLLQVFDNILNNAIKQTHPENRSIEINLVISPVLLQVKIQDNGTGIAPEDIERIFEQFVSIATEYSATGTGIGLYLSQKIMQAHGGSIRAHSEGKGLGSTFTMELPRI